MQDPDDPYRGAGFHTFAQGRIPVAKVFPAPRGCSMHVPEVWISEWLSVSDQTDQQSNGRSGNDNCGQRSHSSRAARTTPDYDPQTMIIV